MRRRAAFGIATLLTVGVGVAFALAQSRAARVEQGGRVFVDSGCHGCHTVGKLGTPIGPDLSHLGSKYAPDYLERWLRDPLGVRPNAHMPALELAEDQVLALAAHLSSLR
jgi:cytochrome c oxidase subunit 2